MRKSWFVVGVLCIIAAATWQLHAGSPICDKIIGSSKCSTGGPFSMCEYNSVSNGCHQLTTSAGCTTCTAWSTWEGCGGGGGTVWSTIPVLQCMQKPGAM